MGQMETNTAGAAPAVPAADLEEARRFLDALDAQATGWTFQTFDDNADRKKSDLARTLHGTLQQHGQALTELQQRGAGVFVTINQTDLTGRKAENVQRVRAAFVDLDGSPIEPVKQWLEPHIVVDSSPGRFHAYWRLDGLEIEEFRKVQKALIGAFDADKGVHDLPRVMRLPGFHHQKVDKNKGLIGTPYMVRMRDGGAFPAPFPAQEFRDKLCNIAPPPPPPLSEQARIKIDTGRAYHGDDQASPAEIEEALSYIDPDLRYDEWRGVLMALHDELGDQGLAIADRWSSQGAKYRNGDVANKWRSFKPGGGVSIKTVFAAAKQAGADLGAISKRHKGPNYSPAKGMAEDLKLVTDKTGRPYWNTANAVEVLTSHPAWRGVLAYNDFTRRRVLLKPIPGTRCSGQRNLEDDDATAVLSWFNRNGFPKASANVVLAAMHAVARRNTFDPLKDYLTGLQWDGERRLEEWLITYCGAQLSDYTREIGKRWMISAVARALKPGCKADHMLVLEGEQGARKSSALAALAGEAWFTDALPPMNTKDASDFLRGRWIVEVAELEAMRREMDAVKAFISRQIESFRPAYGRETVDEPRRCIFAGTTNKDAWLRDETGGRRFWPVKVGIIDLDAIKRDRAQLWAEAVALFRAGEKWWLEGHVEGTARDEQASRMADDPWLVPILEAVQGRSEITIREIMATMGFVPADMTRKDSDRVAAILKRQGWKRTGRATSGPLKGQAVFTPPD